LIFVRFLQLLAPLGQRRIDPVRRSFFGVPRGTSPPRFAKRALAERGVRTGFSQNFRRSMDRYSVSSIAATALVSVVGLLGATPARAVGEGLEIFPDERVFYLIALFVLLVLPVNKVLFQPIFRVLEEREARIEGVRRKAEEIGANAEATLGRYRAALQGAREQAEGGRRAVLEEARREQTQMHAGVRAEVESEIHRARDEVANALAQARAQLRGQAQELAREAAARVLGRSLT
jgi:F-type H+-transporting ATPase subunit b